MEGQIIIIGCGPGSPECLTGEAIRAAGNCSCLIGSERLVQLFPSFGGAKIPLGSNMVEALESIEKVRSSGTVGVLVSGDPGVFSLARLVRKKFGSRFCRTIPGISSLQVAFARIGLDWADARVITSHAHDPDSNVVSSLHSESKIAIFLGRSDSLDWVRSFLASHQREVRCFLFENLTLEDETITEIETCSITEMSVSSRSLMLVVDRGLLE